MKTTRITLLFLVALPFFLFSQTTIIFPTGDTYITKGNTTGNVFTQGMETNLYSFREPTNLVWSTVIYLKFDLQSISSAVGNAKLRLYGTAKEAHGFDVYSTSLSNWVEDQLTYNNAASLTGLASTNPVASLDVVGSTTAKYFEWDVSTAVTAAIAKGESFITLKLQDRYAVRTTTNAMIQVVFHSKENSSGYKPQLVITPKDISAFKLSDLKLNGVTIAGFNATKVRYDVTLPYGNTAPSVSATQFSSNYTLKHTPATNLFGTESQRTTKVVNTNDLATDSVVFKVVFNYAAAPTDARLDTLRLNGVDVENFNMNKLAYKNYLPYTTTVSPTIQALGFNRSASITITNPTNLKGTLQERMASILVKSQDNSSSKTYTIEFEILPKLDIFLAIGQSNMSGRGILIPGDSANIANVYLLTKGANVEIAANPLNKYSSLEYMANTNLIGPANSFVKMMRDKTGNSIGIVHNSLGATKISQWMKGSTDKFYEEALRRLKEMRKFGDIKGVIWHQGEGDSWATTTYLASLKQMITDYRTDLSLPNLFFVVGQVGQWVTSYQTFNTVIPTVSTVITNTECASSLGLVPTGGVLTDPHFDRASQIILGERYATIMLKNVYGITAVPAIKENIMKMAKIIAANKTIRIEGITQNLNVNIIDLTGKCLVKKNLHASDNYSVALPSGVYIVQLSASGNIQTMKVIL
jgi:hypothetical protein